MTHSAGGETVVTGEGDAGVLVDIGCTESIGIHCETGNKRWERHL